MSTPVTFVKKGNISYMIPVGKGKDQAEKVANDLVRRALGGRNIHFTHRVPSGIASPECSFTTDNPIVSEFLIKWNKRTGNILSMDISLVPLRCPYCSFETKNGSDDSRDELSRHVVEMHSGLSSGESEEGALISVDADGKLIDPDNHKLVDLKSLAVDAGGDEVRIASITSKQGVVDYLRENVPTVLAEAV